MRTNPLPPTTPGRDQTHPPVPFNPIHKPQKRKVPRIIGIVFLSITGVSVLVVVAVIIYAMSAFGSVENSCTAKRTSMYTSAQRAIPAFNQVTVIPGVVGSTASEQKQDGDCVDSLPTAWLQRTFTVNETAGQAMTQVNATLESEGYASPTHDSSVNPNASPCSVAQGDGLGITYSNPSRPSITITMNCDDGDGMVTTWQSLPVTTVDAEVMFAAQS